MKRICIIIVLVFLTVTAVAAEEEPIPAPDLADIEVLDLQTAQRLALKGNPDLAAAMSRIEQARARVNQAMAAWWPTLDVTGTLAGSVDQILPMIL